MNKESIITNKINYLFLLAWLHKITKPVITNWAANPVDFIIPYIQIKNKDEKLANNLTINSP